MPRWTKFYLNAVMHATFLFAILVAMFVLVISQKEKSAIQSELQDGITTFLAPVVAQGQPLYNALLVISDAKLQNLDSVFSKADAYIDDENNRQIVEAVTIISLMVFGFAGTYLCLRLSSNFCHEIHALLLENIITFMFVGAIEYWFFTTVALKFIPTPPSYFVTTLRDEVLKQLATFIH